MYAFSTAALFAASILPFAQAASVCYGFNGNQDPSLGVCDPNAATSSCCRWGDECLSNGLCQDPARIDGTLVYGVRGCTVAGGNTAACLAFSKCYKSGSPGLQRCPISNDTTQYCCYGTSGCDCNNTSLLFTLPNGNITQILPANAAAASAQAATRSSSTMTSTMAVSTSTSATASASSTGTASSGSSVAVGAGVGVGVGVAALLAIAGGLWYWRRKKYAGKQPVSQDDDSGHEYRTDYKQGPAALAPPVYSPSAYSPADAPYEDRYTNELDASQHPTELHSESAAKVVTLTDRPLEMA